MGIIDLYKSTLKRTASEEVFDLIFFRPLGFLTAFSLKRTFFTPNLITIIAMVFGIMSGVSYFNNSYLLGAIYLLISNVLDCSDGQLARMKGTSSQIGRVLDGFADYVTYTAVYAGIAFGMMWTAGNWDWMIFGFGLIVSISTIIQAAVFDDYRNRYISTDSIEEMKAEAEEFRILAKESRNPFKSGLFYLYVFYTEKQIKMREKKPDLVVSSLFIRLLSFVGSTTHITLIATLTIIRRVDWYFYAVAGVLNIHLIIMLIFQKKLNKVSK